MNTHGGNGRNIPCDLHNEHVNMGASTRSARSVTTIAHLVDSQVGMHPESLAHRQTSNRSSNQKILEVQTEHSRRNGSSAQSSG